ncbi:MAG TPA: leucine efflux protein LeuE [Nevskiaceae bacterium]|nr:leucine efflux protein LeuE [Nevskiaceae bacterium]
MFGIVDLPNYLAIVVVTILLPGPNSMFVLSVAARQGVADGYKAALGVFVSDSILMVVSVTGVASILHAYPQLFTALKLAGAGYLAWIGVSLVRSGLNAARAPVEAELPAPVRVEDPFRRVVLIGLLNPKAIFFFMAFFIQFVDRSYAHPALSFVLLGAMLQAISMLYLSMLIFAGARLARAFRERRRLAAGATGGAGLMFLGFSAKLASMAAQ